MPAPTGSGSVLPPDGRRMLEAIDRLPEAEREVFGPVRIQALTQGEAAEVLGVSAKTVQRRLNRSLVPLARELVTSGRRIGGAGHDRRSARWSNCWRIS